MSFFKKRRGIVVAVLGVDGSGKSTIIDSLVPCITASFGKEPVVQHLRPMLLPPLGSLKSGKRSLSRKTVFDPHGSRPAGLIGSTIRLVWLWADYVIGHWAIVRPQIRKASTVFLFDRYADDLALDPRRFRLGGMNGFARLIPLMVPRPDLVLALVAEPKQIHERKPELPVEEIERQVEALRCWALERPEAFVINTCGSIAEARDNALSAILKVAAKRQ